MELTQKLDLDGVKNPTYGPDVTIFVTIVGAHPEEPQMIKPAGGQLEMDLEGFLRRFLMFFLAMKFAPRIQLWVPSETVTVHPYPTERVKQPENHRLKNAFKKGGFQEGTGKSKFMMAVSTCFLVGTRLMHLMRAFMIDKGRVVFFF